MPKSLGMFGAASILFTATLAGAASQQEASQPSRWQVDYGESRCTLSRVFGDEAPVSLGIRISPGNEAADIMVVNPAWAADDRLPARIEVVLQPSGARLPAAFASSSPVPSGQHRFVRLSAVDRSFYDLFAASSSLSLEGGGRELVSVPLTQTRDALVVLRACHDDLMRGWGIDPAAMANLRRAPIPLRDTDRMMGSEEDMTAGDSTAAFVVIRYTIGTNGRVGDCEVVRSGGSEAGAQRLCQRARREARYEPALGADGQPVAVQRIQTMTIVRR